MSIVQTLSKKQLIRPPSFVISNCLYETIMGSQAYGLSSNDSDWDVYGFCVPEKEMLFPHLRGEVLDFGTQTKRFNQWQLHHIMDREVDRQYDIVIYSIVTYFNLCMQNNPNMIDSLFTPRRCVVHSTTVSEMVRENRKLFLTKKCWHTYKGYAYSQMSKIDKKANRSNPKRQADIEEHGYDLKFAYHVVRLLNEVEQILTEGDLDLERNREQLKSIRRGDWTVDQVFDYFQMKEPSLEVLYTNSKLRAVPDEEGIKSLLLNCLEHHYGDLSKAVARPNRERDLINQIDSLILNYKNRFLE